MTYTYVVMQISGDAYNEIARKMHEAGCYDHAFHKDSQYGTLIDMHGIAVAPVPVPEAEVEKSIEKILDTPEGERLDDILPEPGSDNWFSGLPEGKWTVSIDGTEYPVVKKLGTLKLKSGDVVSAVEVRDGNRIRLAVKGPYKEGSMAAVFWRFSGLARMVAEALHRQRTVKIDWSKLP